MRQATLFGRVAWHASYAEPDVVELSLSGAYPEAPRTINAGLRTTAYPLESTAYGLHARSPARRRRREVGFREPWVIEVGLGPSTARGEMKTLLAKFEPIKTSGLSIKCGRLPAGAALRCVDSAGGKQVRDKELARSTASS